MGIELYLSGQNVPTVGHAADFGTLSGPTTNPVIFCGAPGKFDTEHQLSSPQPDSLAQVALI